ncbi:MAG: hypothetical protein P1Q69_08520, partial [Candidatus Thorarchaeota archaeon]|nr:hypothetical protein [Candidatus Thorarchaeota archaeon]
MSNACQIRYIIPITFLIFLGSLIMVQGPVGYDNLYGSFESPEIEEHTLVLTQELQSIGFNVDRYATKAVITNLMTNNTPISISARNEENEVLLNMSGINRIVGDSVAVESATSLNFTRQDSDATVTFTLEVWFSVPVAIDV